MTDTNNDKEQIVSGIAASFRAGDFQQAERLARRLGAEGNNEQALYLVAQAIYKQNRYAEAVRTMEALLALNPMSAAYHNDYGVMLAALGRWAEAETAHRMSLVLDKTGLDARFNLALVLLRQQKGEAALEALDELQNAAPEFAEQYALRGEVLQSLKRPVEAVVALSKALELGLRNAEILAHLGAALSDAGNKDEAFALLAQAGALDSEDAAANFHLGRLFREQGDLAKAAKHFSKAVEAFPDFAEAQNNLGLVMQAQGDHAGAEAAFKRALQAAPEMAAVHNNLGNTRLQQGNMELALACFRKAVKLSPDLAAAWNNLGETCYRLQLLDEAEAAYRKALAIDPGQGEAELNLGILLLLRGDFAEGWKYYERRWDMPHVRAKRPRFTQPEWAGEPLDGKTLLVYVEQGMGDNLQFIRFLRVLRDRYPSARIYYWGLRPLTRLFAEFAADCKVEILPETIPGGVPQIDYHIALLSIPRHLGTTLDTIPPQDPPLQPPEELVARWRERLSGLKGKKVGLVWASGETYLFHMFRTMRLAQLKPLLDIEGISWVSLQKGGASQQIEAEGLAGRIYDAMGEVEDFADTAAIIANLDLVLSVDTSVAHLAGAMGAPVWLLDRFDTDWRWLLNRSDSPWYPSLRIFRQTSFANWDSVVSEVHSALAGWALGSTVPTERPEMAPTMALSEAGLKLNLGCGNRKMAGFLNVDFVEACHPDQVVNLEETPWPWATDSVDEIKLIHVLEHLGQRTDVFLAIVKEMYRVCRDAARIEIIVPHPRSDHFLGDPTHVRPVTPSMLSLFDQRLNREWAEQGAANTPLGQILGVDFEIDTVTHTLDGYWQQKLSSGELSDAEMQQAARQFNNVIVQSTIIWRVRKPKAD